MLFVDSSAFIAYFISSDTNHDKTKELFDEIAEKELVTSQEIIDETLNWLTRKVPKKTYELGNLLLSGDIARILQTLKEDKVNALEIIKKYSDHSLSFTDAISFTVIKRLKIKDVFSLDKDFNLLKVNNIFFSYYNQSLRL